MANRIQSALNPLLLLYQELAESRALSRSLRESRIEAASAAAAAKVDATSGVTQLVIECGRAFEPCAPASERPEASKREKIDAACENLRLGVAMQLLPTDVPSTTESSACEGAAQALAAADEVLGEQRRELLATVREMADAAEAAKRA